MPIAPAGLTRGWSRQGADSVESLLTDKQDYEKNHMPADTTPSNPIGAVKVDREPR